METRNSGIDSSTTGNGSKPRVVVVGGGFAGFTCARDLEKKLEPEDAELVMVSPTDYMLYSPLLPEVSAGVVDPRHIVVPLHGALHRTRVIPGHATDADLDANTLTVSPSEGSVQDLSWDRLVLAAGGVTRAFPIPGLEEQARGFKNIGEALYLRDHVLKQLELADACGDADERRARLTFAVVGAGYAGTEFAAQMQLFTKRAIKRYPRLREEELRWMLLDLAPKVLPELGDHLGDISLALLKERGMEIRLGTSVESADENGLKLTDDSYLPTHTLVWCAGVAASPLVSTLGQPLAKGRLVVDSQLRVGGRNNVFALGDCAAVPDLTKSTGTVAPPTAQHATRQGKVAARNVAASLGHGTANPYKHNDLGLVVDLGGRDAAAKPVGFRISGIAAKIVTRAYHLYALPSTPQRLRVGLDWVLDALLPRLPVQFGLIPEDEAPLAAAEDTDIYAGHRDEKSSESTSGAGAQGAGNSSSSNSGQGE